MSHPPIPALADLPLDELARPASAEEIRALKNRVRGDSRWTRAIPKWHEYGTSGIIMLLVGAIGVFFAYLMISSHSPEIAPWFLITFCLLQLVALPYWIIKNRPRWGDWARMVRFADATGMEFAPLPHKTLPQTALLGPSARDYNGFSSRGGLRLMQRADNMSSTRIQRELIDRPGEYAYLRIPLGVQMPHIVLDSRRNDGVAGWRSRRTRLRLADDQRIELEGDFPRAFGVYAPEALQRDALYFLTPDFMETLALYATEFDLEFSGSDLILVSTRPMNLADPDVWLRFFTAADAVLSHLRPTASAYRRGTPIDPRTPPSRLRWGFPIGTALALAAFIAWRVFVA
ncbi:hypothetical protein D9V32_08285 [Mycetocola tolaasinivorans]|uniref:DUF3137 domain-containing protein n=1 Tax=Mycetocola tolaasinivorans TaxID=76635 RepID=A0A3L7A8J8_9MICO|nr:hypothetical protein [Mycetocola tolaasinivorans]RLP76140.1 hypothetical protein D9V32_08285 [Mycetocola tolaasinivorans]